VHTLKGNAGVFGLRLLAERCNELENHIAEEGVQSDMEGLFQTWDRVRGDISTLIGEARHSGVEIDESDYRAVCEAVFDGVDAQRILRMLESWRLEPTAKRLARIEQQIRGIAERMGKDNVTVVVASNGLRFNPEGFGPFWSAFVHVLRNAVDHGTEALDVRRALGKPDQCTIRVATTLEAGSFVVTVEDDGPGIAWAALRAKAASLGLHVADAEEVIFLPGVSSRSTVNEYSGRGVGMGAVRDACQALEGAIEISAGPDGQGTRFRFVFPGARAYEGHPTVLGRVGVSG
jgi:two-component system chemotaxis sensor kinase CheA